jgi:hypothetical protein
MGARRAYALDASKWQSLITPPILLSVRTLFGPSAGDLPAGSAARHALRRRLRARQDDACEAFRGLLPTVTASELTVCGNRTHFTPHRLLPYGGAFYGLDPRRAHRVLGYGVFAAGRPAIPLCLVMQKADRRECPPGAPRLASVRLFFVTPGAPHARLLRSCLPAGLPFDFGALFAAPPTGAPWDALLAPLRGSPRERMAWAVATWQTQLDRAGAIDLGPEFEPLRPSPHAMFPLPETPAGEPLDAALLFEWTDPLSPFQAAMLLQVAAFPPGAEKSWLLFIVEAGAIPPKS